VPKNLNVLKYNPRRIQAISKKENTTTKKILILLRI